MNKTRNGIILTLIMNIVLPYAAYTLLIGHTDSLTALSVAALIPLADSLYSLAKTRKVDAFSGFIFLGIVLSILAVLLGGDERFILLRESYITGIMGILFLASLLFSKPLIYYFAMRFNANRKAMADRWERLPGFRNTFRLMTLVWGLSLLLEAVVKVVLVYSLSIPAFLALSPFFSYGIIGLTIWWNVVYTRRIRKRYTAS
ncbi:hypothetical protein LJK88_02285 [Paenibacillus sp. P26]|nr:hypothetical protein LJK88_02285 [Paenibacillus sp. P26]UUZ90996.1 hypothetical protein LJK87_35205 [Paenibacillus sp. P25]